MKPPEEKLISRADFNAAVLAEWQDLERHFGGVTDPMRHGAMLLELLTRRLFGEEEPLFPSLQGSIGELRKALGAQKVAG